MSNRNYGYWVYDTQITNQYSWGESVNQRSHHNGGPHIKWALFTCPKMSKDVQRCPKLTEITTVNALELTSPCHCIISAIPIYFAVKFRNLTMNPSHLWLILSINPNTCRRIQTGCKLHLVRAISCKQYIYIYNFIIIYNYIYNV